MFGVDERDDAFCRRFIGWDRACPDPEAARIVTEVLSASDDAGQIVCVGEEVVRGAIRWMSEVAWLSVAERANLLRDGVTAPEGAVAADFVAFLATADDLDAAAFRSAVESLTRRLRSHRLSGTDPNRCG